MSQEIFFNRKSFVHLFNSSVSVVQNIIKIINILKHVKKTIFLFIYIDENF